LGIGIGKALRSGSDYFLAFAKLPIDGKEYALAEVI
jgi:hypothetical protein